MAQQPMYNAVVNSPPTELAADITASDTTITVVNAAVLPPAPNLLTIGVDETAETVRYTVVSGNTLTVERAFQGTAKAWSAGAKVARYYTAYDHNVFVSNISDVVTQLGTKETPSGAQAKANAAETNAKNASLPRTGGTINGALTVDANAGGFTLVGEDHFYVPYYPEGIPAGRKAYHGFAGQGEHAFKLVNEYPDGTFVFEASGKSVDIFDLKQSVSNGKAQVAAVIGNVASTATFQQLHDQLWIDKNGMIARLANKGVNMSGVDPETTALGVISSYIDQVTTGKKFATVTGTTSSTGTFSYSGLDFQPAFAQYQAYSSPQTYYGQYREDDNNTKSVLSYVSYGNWNIVRRDSYIFTPTSNGFSMTGLPNNASITVYLFSA